MYAKGGRTTDTLVLARNVGPSTAGKVIKGVTSGVCWLYAASIISLTILRIYSPGLPPFLALINSLTPFLFVPLPFVFLLACMMRSKYALIAGSIVLIVFVGLYGNLFLPRLGKPARETHQELRVMTFNLGLNLSQPEEMAAIIEAQGADIVAMQEMTTEMARLFERELGAIYPYTVLHPRETTGPFSRYRILEQEWIAPVEGGRSYIRAVVEWNSETVNVFVVHPLPPGLEWYRDTIIPIGLHDTEPQRQIDEVTKRATSEGGFALIVGDFNLGDHAPGYTIIAEEFTDAYREAGWGFGFTFPKGLRVGKTPVPGPFTRIDYIFHSRGLYTNWARVGCEGSSDHCYVLAQLARKDS
jgi:vancomycin resistance protein VanJ